VETDPKDFSINETHEYFSANCKERERERERERKREREYLFSFKQHIILTFAFKEPK